MRAGKKILLIVLLVVIAGAFYIYREYNRTNIDIANETPAFEISDAQLIKAFADNDSIANSTYVGKVISVSGTVKNINKDQRGYYTVSLGDSSSPSSVRCSVDSMYTDRAATIKPGMKLAIKGNCTGYNADELLGLDVIVNRCVIEDN
jgi:cbb3-type cytochrome oxidase subunit 3